MQFRPIGHGLILSACLALPFAASAQVAGTTVLGTTQSVYATAANGWSVKKAILDHDVYNDDAKPEVVGSVEDIIIAPKGSVSYAVVNASKYLGLSSHYVLIPAEQFHVENQRITLPDATKEALRNVPEFKYNRNADEKLK
ncbi:PRC-barrel domain-containing protein [Comamonas flocculans]|uniref:PRC-barrel domain containing protein n=1 Tax=Comamonas flocculans TaxID=2597701 RepID=A0A5B8RWB4_9BURK|nr:PRC-barrel domain-containing protein [Comamonas flocculans]QEA13800.1 PRC-barrel domain containing protein [Comamonas flocculans]